MVMEVRGIDVGVGIGIGDDRGARFALASEVMLMVGGGVWQ